MGARFGFTINKSAVTTTAFAAGRLTASASKRVRLYDLLIGQGGTPADNFCTWDMIRQTVLGTDTAITAGNLALGALDPADIATTATAGTNETVVGTVTANTTMFHIDINQRASYRWVAAPGGELVIPAVAANGIVARVLSPAYTGAAGGAIMFEE